MWSHVCVDNHLCQPILSVPSVGPAAVIRQVPVRIVSEHFRFPCDIHVPSHILPACHHDVRPQRRRAVVRRELFSEILLVPICRLPIDGHSVGQDARAHDVHIRRNVPVRRLEVAPAFHFIGTPGAIGWHVKFILQHALGV